MTSSPSRRTILAGSAATAAAALSTDLAEAAPAQTSRSITRIEETYDRIIGVYARNLRTGRTLAHRADTRFAMCSTFKVPLAAAVLAGHLVTDDRQALRRRMAYPPSMVPEDLWAPTTTAWLAQGYVPTLAQMCEAAVVDSDNGAANVIIQQVGGPDRVTGYFRSIGDRTSRLDRWEPEMSMWDARQHRDTTTPQAMATAYRDLLLGRALPSTARRRLLRWSSATSEHLTTPFREALPRGWRIADKTGSGDFASRNDVGIIWDEADVPYVISCYTRSERVDDTRIEEPLTAVFTACLKDLS